MTWGELAAGLYPPPPGVQRQPARAVSRPNHLLGIEAVNDFWGTSTDMLPPTRAEAMSVPAMARARHIVCTAARLPLIVDPADFRYQTLIRQPDPARTRAAVLTDTLDSLLFHGAALWRVTARYKQRADRAAGPYTGRPQHAEAIDLARYTRDPDTGQDYIDEQPVNRFDLVWFEGPHEGVLSFGGRSMRAAVRLDRAYAATAANPAIAAEVHQLSGDVLSDEEVTATVEDVRSAIASRGVVYTNEALELRTHTAAAENLLISGRNAAAVDIARMVGLPAPVIDAHAPGSSGTYSNVQARLREARDIGVDAYCAPIAQRLSMDDILPAGVTCAFLWDALLRDDFTERMNGYKAAQEAGVYTADECRAMEVGPSPEGSVPA